MSGASVSISTDTYTNRHREMVHDRSLLFAARNDTIFETNERECILKIHILGICGTFMGGLAQLCCQKGWDVTGSDQHVYPPMSDQLRDAGIVLHEGFDTTVLTDDLDMVVIGNVMSRGNPVVEAVLDRKISFVSGPELLGHLTIDMTVLAVSGTHGKTTTTSMLAWILEFQGLEPGFLIGGVPRNFGVSARLGSGQYFVVEADEYDTAFFDKRSKFVHYHPDILGINNLEFDHADIFADLTAIETQFHHVIRRVPASGCVISRSGVEAIDRVLAHGCWSRQKRVGQDTEIEFVAKSNELISDGLNQSVRWTMRGTHNAHNAELAVAMAHAIGLPMRQSFSTLASFEGVARRLNLLYETAHLKIWDDFAHHPTAIETTLNALSESDATHGPLIAVIELRSNTMKAGIHGSSLLDSTTCADRVIWVLSTETEWDTSVLERSDGTSSVVADLLSLEHDLVGQTTGQIVFMSNGGFSGIQSRVVERLQER